MKHLVIAIALLAWSCTARADLDAREAQLAAQLRCVVCQNQTIAESNAPLAADMRREIRAQLQAGRSDQEVLAFFEQRYGSFVRYTPPLRPSTWLLWGLPFLALLAGMA
ncbi:MAG TPA: cytochrome c-type biogenesis protein, partial [Roseateles sp.]